MISRLCALMFLLVASAFAQSAEKPNFIIDSLRASQL